MRRHLLPLAAIAAAVALSSCSQAQRDDDGAVVEAGTVGARTLQLGDCFQDGAIADDATEVASLDAVPCEEPHDNEVYAIFDLPDGDYPGEDAVVQLAIARCEDDFAGFVGVGYNNALLDITYLYPLEPTWPDDREVVCAVYDPVGPVTGTLEGQGDSYRVAVEGECMDEAGLAVDCSTEHYAELYLETELEGETFPGVETVDEEAFALCHDAYAAYVGTEWDSSALDFVYWAPDEASWDAGFTLVSCAVIEPEGSLTGSIQGSGR